MEAQATLRNAALGKARYLLGFFVIPLTVSGLTAIPLQLEVHILQALIGEGTFMEEIWPALSRWISFVHQGVTESYAMQDITVTTFDDEYNTNPSACSLREAIVAVNTGNAFGGCSASNGTNTINLPVGTYTLSISGEDEDNAASGDLDISSSLTINGVGVDTTVIAAATTLNDRVFHVLSTAAVTISHVTVSGGYTNRVGGGIFNNNGQLALSNLRLADNEAFIDGGGLYSSGGSVTITNSTIESNRAWFSGGGIRSNGGTLTLNNSSISGNQAGGGGGGFSNFTGIVTVTNSTLSGNQASGGGGLATQEGSLTLINNSIYDNHVAMKWGGGGISRLSSAGTVNIKNTILAGNTDGDGGAPDCSGYIPSQGHNLVGDGTGCSGFIDSDQVGTSGSQIDPRLGQLQDKGGPTLTHALLAGSPAINTGTNDGCPSTDQRGLIRPQGGICDIGAYEV